MTPDSLRMARSVSEAGAQLDPKAVLNLLDHIEKQHVALTKIDAVRNSIIGTQACNWSAHIYPLVAALEEAGYEGQGYDEARAEAVTLLEQRNRAEAALSPDPDTIKSIALRAIVIAELPPPGWRGATWLVMSDQEYEAFTRAVFAATRALLKPASSQTDDTPQEQGVK